MSSENNTSTITEEKSVLNTDKVVSNKNSPEHQAFLNKKRKLSLLENNYLIRRIISPIKNEEKEECEYETISNSYYLLMDFDWKENLQNNHFSKNYSILQRIRANSLWFYFNSCYFPFKFNELLESYEYLPELIQKNIIERNADSLIKKTSARLLKEAFILDVENSKEDVNNFNINENIFNNIYNENMNNNNNINENNENNQKFLNKFIQNYQNKYEKIKKSNEEKIIKKFKKIKEEMKQKMYILAENYDSNLSYNNNLHMDMSYNSKKIKKFTELCIKKNESRVKISDEKDPDDVLCQVCNDGDYEDDNLIVYCSLCKLTVHQKCYGITELPKGNWYCHSCLIYKNPNHLKNLECVLCTCRGGAMKPCSLKKSIGLYNTIISYRNDDPNYKKIVEEINKNNSNNNNNQMILDIEDEDSNKPNEDINEKIANEHAWVHLSCALWIPDINIEDFEKKEKIKGFDKIKKENYKKECDICLKSGYGPVVKCERCSLKFHPECARRNNYLMEVSENQSEIKYHIFCHRDAPHKLIKTRELKKQREKDDITQFSEIIDKNIENYNKNNKNNQLSVYNKSKNEKSNYMKKGFKQHTLNKNDQKSLINVIRELAIDISNINIEIDTKDYSIIPSSNKIKLSYNDLMMPSKFPWYILNKNEEFLHSIKPYSIFSKYKNIIIDENLYKKQILKMTQKEIDKNKKEINKNNRINGKKKNSAINTVDNQSYCVCKSLYDSSLPMIECSNYDNKCEGNNWYHYNCLEELKGVTANMIEGLEVYYCPSCRLKYNLPETLKNYLCIYNQNNNNKINELGPSSPVHSDITCKSLGDTDHSLHSNLK